MVSYNDLADIEREEGLSNTLSKLPDGFYPKVGELLSSKLDEIITLKDEEKEIADREYRNMKKLFSRIVEKRMSKIFLMVSRGIRPQNLTEEEEVLVDAIFKAKKEFDDIINGKLSKSSTKEENIDTGLNARTQEQQVSSSETVKSEEKSDEAHSGKQMIKLKFVKFVDAYRGMDGQVYGPFKAGDVSSLPKEEAEWLISAGFAEKSN